MSEERETLLSVDFEAEVIEWRGPAPFVFATIPAGLVGEIRFAARQASYGWGVVPVEANIAGHVFRTSLFPRDGLYLLPVKRAVQNATGIALGDRVTVTLRIEARV